jgi:hypothetical protein
VFFRTLDSWFLHAQQLVSAIELAIVQLAFLLLRLYIVSHLTLLLYRFFRRLFFSHS